LSAVIRAFEDAGVMFLSATKVAARVAQRASKRPADKKKK